MREWILGWRDEFQPAFWEAKRALMQACESAFGEHGVHEGQQFILMCLWREDGLAPGELARRLGLATPTVTRTTQRMAGTGLVRREPHPTDARSVRVFLTERGAALREVLNDEVDRLSERALRGLDDGERRAFVGMLELVHANLSGDSEEASAR